MSTKNGFFTEMSQKVYLTQQEDPKERSIRNKQHKTKEMFFTEVARPCFDEDRNCAFDRKI
jgi:hypothetical protein